MKIERFESWLRKQNVLRVLGKIVPRNRYARLHEAGFVKLGFERIYDTEQDTTPKKIVEQYLEDHWNDEPDTHFVYTVKATRESDFVIEIWWKYD